LPIVPQSFEALIASRQGTCALKRRSERRKNFEKYILEAAIFLCLPGNLTQILLSVVP